MELNDSQKIAVSHFEGPMMVLAGPGSGKTRVITHRVRFLIEEKHVDPSNILVITFTKAAAVEMRQRYHQMMPSYGMPVLFSTFHSIFFTILKHAYHYKAGNIIREDMRRQLLKEIVDETDIEIQDENEFLNDLGAEISRVKGGRMDLMHYYSPNCPGDTFRRIYEKYQDSLARKRLLDFDDMLVYCYELLDQRPDIRKMWQKQFPYILIDEFQDINQVQYDVVRLLAQPGNNLFIVGDDDQSIYGFRGARPDIMQSFVKEYSPEICRLNINYRSKGEIIALAGRVIGHNKNRLKKKIVGTEKEFLQGSAVRIQEFQGITEQNEKIREEILDYRNKGIPYREMAVLFRTNTQARAISAKLKEYNIPFVMREMVPNLYDHWIVKDILTYIRVAMGNRERSSILRIINRPKRYVHRNALTEPYIDLKELELFYEDKDWMVDRIVNLRADLGLIADMRPYAAVNFIRRGVGYDDYIQEYAEYRGIRANDMYEILDEFQEASKGFKNYEEWFEYIHSYGEELKKQSEKGRQGDAGQPEDAVMLMTMHGSKGLEFECVFIPDVNEGITPYNKAVLSEDIEEERRMFYVAMTRAKTHLHIYYLKERFSKEVSVSRFVGEMLGTVATASGKTEESTGACRQTGAG